MTEALERDLTTQEQLDNAHDAEFNETIGRLNGHESAQEAIPQTISYKIKSGDTLISITKNEILKYYPQLDENDKKKLTNPNTSPVIALLRTYNGGSDNLQAGKTLTIDMGPITQAIQNYLNNKNGGNNGHESAQEAIPQTISYKIKSGDTLISITKNEILKYYPQLDENDKKKLTNPNTSPVIALLKTYNGGSDNLQVGKTLTIDMGPITQAIQNYLNNKNGGNNGNESAPQQQTQPQAPQQQPQAPGQRQSIEEMSGDILKYKVKKGDTIEGIVKNKILKDEKLISKYYPQLDKIDREDKRLMAKLVNILKNKFGTKLQIGQTLEIDMKEISQAIQKHLEIIERTGGLIHITSLQEFKDSEEPIIIRLKNDSDFVNKLTEKLKKGPVNIPRYLENRKSEKHTAEEITRPDSKMIEKRKDTLKGKTFVLDAGHGESDPGTMGIVQNEKGEQVVMFESAIAMDVTYRTAQLLRACGANVQLTHYIPNRGICNEQDLPPCLGLPNEKGDSDGLFTDIMRRDDINHLTKPKTFSGKVGKTSMTKVRKEETETISKETGNVDMFVSLHMNSGTGTKKILYETNGSDTFANHLKSSGFGNAENKAGYPVLHPTCCPAVIVEMGGIENQDDANVFRDPQQRQEKAEDLVNAMISYDRPKPSN